MTQRPFKNTPPLKTTLVLWSAVTAVMFGSSHWCNAARNTAFTLGTVSLGGGIASPGLITSVFENPAGLAFSDHLQFFNAYTLVPDSGFKDAGYGLQVSPGGPDGVGFSMGIRHQPQNDRVTTTHYGMGLDLSGISTAIGFAASTPISPSGASSFNAGALINPLGVMRLGFTAIGFTGGVEEFGAGVGAELSPGVDLGVDATADPKIKNRAIAPGLRIGNTHASISVSYGIALDGDAVSSRQITDQFSGGVSLMLTRGWTVQALYERFSKWTLGLTGTF